MNRVNAFMVEDDKLVEYYGNGKKIEIPYEVAIIGKRAFFGCDSIESVVIPKGVTRIEEGAFEGCCSLKSVIIADSVTHIGDRAFYGCANLKKLSVKKGVKFGCDVFEGCPFFQKT